MASRNWSNLSSSYRTRLEKAGISKRDYESGASLTTARGHSKTPEHPERAHRNPQKYQSYLNERGALQRELIALKQQKFGSNPRFNDRRSARAVTIGKNGHPPTRQHLKEAISIVRSGIRTYFGMADEYDDEVFDLLFYH